MKNALFISFVGAFASSAMAQTKKSLCPKILSASNLSAEFHEQELTEYFAELDQGTLVKAIPDAKLTQSVLYPGEKSIHYSVRIEEVNSKTGAVVKALNLNCPVVKDWSVDVLPSVEFRKWEGLTGSQEPARPGQAQVFERSGLRVVKFFQDSADYYSISLLWDLYPVSKPTVTPLPSFVKDAQVKRTDLKIDPSRIPVRALRISTSGKFGNVWYVLTDEALRKVGSLDLLSPHDERNGPETRRELASIDFLDYYDSLNARFFPCSHILGKTEDQNCFFYNSTLHPQLLQIMDSTESIWVQIVLQLDRGFVVQTYRLGEKVDADPTLVEQIYAKDLSQFNISAEILP